MLYQPLRRHARHALSLPFAVAAVLAAAVLLPAPTVADQASQPSAPAAGQIATGYFHSCAMVAGAVRCCGYGGDGALGYGNTRSIGDDQAPDTVGPVSLGAGRTAVAIAAGSVHTCAILDTGTVRCWGFGADGRLGSGSTSSIGDDEQPSSLPPVSLGAGHTAKAITAGTATPARSSTTTPCAAGASASTAASVTAASTASATTRLRAFRRP